MMTDAWYAVYRREHLRRGYRVCPLGAIFYDPVPLPCTFALPFDAFDVSEM
jgi:hypothetical protein